MIRSENFDIQYSPHRLISTASSGSDVEIVTEGIEVVTQPVYFVTTGDDFIAPEVETTLLDNFKEALINSGVLHGRART